MTNLKPVEATAPSETLSDITIRIADASANLDALNGRVLHIASVAAPELGDRDLCQTCYTLSIAIEAIKGKIDDINSDLRAVANRVRP